MSRFDSGTGHASFIQKPMTCFFAWAAALLLLPLIVLLWATESRATRINRLRSNGHTWKAIGARYGVHRTTVKRWAMA